MGELGNFTIDQVAGASALVLGSIGGLLMIIFKSRCVDISICWGMWSCKRAVPEEDSDEEAIVPTKPDQPVGEEVAVNP